jgi:hypothetical protein
MVRAIIGLLKGAIFGGAIGFGLLKLGLTGGFMAYVGCALAGAIVGVIAGRAPWKAETLWTPALKMAFGAAVGAGLCWVGLRFLPAVSFTVPEVGELSTKGAPLLALGVGVLWGMFVEIDDGGAKKNDIEKAPEKSKKK